MEITKENYVAELCSTVKKIEELRDFAKQHPLLYIYLGRCNGKTRFEFRVLKHYSALIQAYEKTEAELQYPKRKTIFKRIFERLKGGVGNERRQ